LQPAHHEIAEQGNGGQQYRSGDVPDVLLAAVAYFFPIGQDGENDEPAYRCKAEDEEGHGGERIGKTQASFHFPQKQCRGNDGADAHPCGKDEGAHEVWLRESRGEGKYLEEDYSVYPAGKARLEAEYPYGVRVQDAGGRVCAVSQYKGYPGGSLRRQGVADRSQCHEALGDYPQPCSFEIPA